MHYLLHVRLQGFYTRVLRDGANGHPLVVHRDKTVIDACPLALERRVDVGMTLSEARAILVKAVFTKWEEEPYRTAQAEWLNICSDYTDVIEPELQHTAFLDLSEHPQPQKIADALIERLKTELGYEVSVGTGNCRWVAALASGFNMGTGPMLKPAQFLRDMSTHCLSTVLPEHRARLVFLGYPKVSDVAQVPLQVLRDQFGDAGFEIYRAVRGGGDPTVEAMWPQGCLASRMSFDGPPEDVMTLFSGFEVVAEQLSENLTSHDLQGKELHVFLEHDNGHLTTLRRVFSKPVQTKDNVMTSIKLMLAEPPETPVVGVRVRMPNLEHVKRIQLAISGQKSELERELSASAAFQHVRRVFGDSAILVAGQMPEPRRRRLLRLWKDATGWA